MVKFPSPLSPTLLSVKLLPVTIYSVFLQKVSSQTVQRYCISVWSVKGNSRLSHSHTAYSSSQSEVFRILPSRLRRKISHLGFSYLFISVCSVYTNWEPHLSPTPSPTLSIDLTRVQSPHLPNLELDSYTRTLFVKSLHEQPAISSILVWIREPGCKPHLHVTTSIRE